jgi:hypothetical protein
VGIISGLKLGLAGITSPGLEKIQPRGTVERFIIVLPPVSIISLALCSAAIIREI